MWDNKCDSEDDSEGDSEGCSEGDSEVGMSRKQSRQVFRISSAHSVLLRRCRVEYSFLKVTGYPILLPQ